MRKIFVKCSYTLEVEVPDDPEYPVEFDIEENHCPGTGLVGAVLDREMEHWNNEGMCWACACGGKNEIVRDSEGRIVFGE